MSLGTILLIVLILMLIGVIPSWPHSRSWGYGHKWWFRPHRHCGCCVIASWALVASVLMTSKAAVAALLLGGVQGRQ